MLRSFPENPRFRPNILGQQALINHKIESYCVTSVKIYTQAMNVKYNLHTLIYKTMFVPS